MVRCEYWLKTASWICRVNFVLSAVLDRSLRRISYSVSCAPSVRASTASLSNSITRPFLLFYLSFLCIDVRQNLPNPISKTRGLAQRWCCHYLNLLYFLLHPTRLCTHLPYPIIMHSSVIHLSYFRKKWPPKLCNFSSDSNSVWLDLIPWTNMLL